MVANRSLADLNPTEQRSHKIDVAVVSSMHRNRAKRCDCLSKSGCVKMLGKDPSPEAESMKIPTGRYI